MQKPGRNTTAMTAVLWALTAAAVGVELYGATTNPAATWTESLARSVPAPLVLAGTAILVRWLPGHFRHAYEQTNGGPTMGPKAKMWVAVIGGAIGSAITGALQLLPDGTVKTILTIVAAVDTAGMTAVGVYGVPNQPEVPAATPTPPADPAPVPVPAGK